MPKKSKKGSQKKAAAKATPSSAGTAADDADGPLRELCYASIKRTRDLFGGEATDDSSSSSKQAKVSFRQQLKLNTEYALVKGMPKAGARTAAPGGGEAAAQLGNTVDAAGAAALANGAPTMLGGAGTAAAAAATSTALVAVPQGGSQLAVRHKAPVPVLQPEWHAPWKLMRVISGHLGWVRAVAVDPANQWFATGAGDRTIKIWDMASGGLKLTLTGHISTIRGLAVSANSPYLFSAAEDKTVKCWDLEQNKVVRHYHGHLSGVYCAALHPTLDVLVTGGRDSTARVWDSRSKNQVHVLAGHTNTVVALGTQRADPQVVTGSMDNTIRYWDLAKGERTVSLTNHKKSVRAVAIHPYEYTMASASADNIKKWKFPRGEFLMNMQGQNAIINAMAVNQENVLATGGDNGSLHFWDWKTGYNYQTTQIAPQPGSLESEAGVFAMSYDVTGTRLITCEADTSIKMWKQDTSATPETHPVNYKPPKDRKRF
jgi:pleiotropic regulator 1